MTFIFRNSSNKVVDWDFDTHFSHERIAQYVKNGSDEVTKVLAICRLTNFSYSGVVNVVLDFLKRCEDETFHELVNTNKKENINTPSLWITILDAVTRDIERWDDGEDNLCWRRCDGPEDVVVRTKQFQDRLLQIAENIGPLVRCMCNDTKRLFFKSEKYWRESIAVFQKLVFNMISCFNRPMELDARKRVTESLLQHDGGILRSIVQWGFWELRPDISNELSLISKSSCENLADMGRVITSNLIVDTDTTDVDGNHTVTDDIERLQIISTTPIVNKEYDPTCMVSFTEGMIRHMKIDEWEEHVDIWTQGDDVFIVEALMQRADCIDKGVITEVIDFGNSVHDYERALGVARLSFSMVQQWISPEKSQASDTRVAFAIRTGLIEMCLALVDRFWVEDDDKEDDSASSVCTSDGSVPLCPGHNKPCKIVTSERYEYGPCKQYYKCNMPEGEQCDFFDYVESHDVYRNDDNAVAAEELEEHYPGYNKVDEIKVEGRCDENVPMKVEDKCDENASSIEMAALLKRNKNDYEDLPVGFNLYDDTSDDDKTSTDGKLIADDSVDAEEGEEEDDDSEYEESIISFGEEDVEDTELFDHIANVFSKVNDVLLHQKTARAIRSKKESISEILIRLEEKDTDDKYKQLLDMVRSILDINGSHCCQCNKSLERTDVKVCNGCHRMAYCSRACQKEDWANGHEHICNKKSTELEIGGIMPKEITDERAAAKSKELEMNISMVQLKLFLHHSDRILSQANSLDIPLADCFVTFDLRRCPHTAEVKRYTEFFNKPEELRMFEESRSSKHIICLYISTLFVGELLDKEQVRNVVMQKLYPHEWLLNFDQR